MPAQGRNREEFDLIVVGSGIGGSIVAARIAQYGVNPTNGEKLRVALLEWGPYHMKGDPVAGYGIPARRRVFDNMPYSDHYYNLLPYGGQALVGGAAVHGGLIAFPPIEIDFEHWREQTGVDWSWEKFNLPLAEVREMWHPYPQPDQIRSPGQKRFRETALGLGYEVREMNQNKLNCISCGCCNGRLCKYDAKRSPLVNYIPVAEREGVQIIAASPVEKVLIEKRGSRPVATGVQYQQDGQLRQAKANKIIVSGGYNGTPRLLYRSGYGPREKVPGELMAENRNVGSNLSSKVAIPGVWALFDDPIKHQDLASHSVYYIREGSDPRGYNRLHVFDALGDRDGSQTWPDQLARSGLAPEFGREFKEYMRKCTTHTGYISVNLCKNFVPGEIDADGRGVSGNQSTGFSPNLTRDFLEKHNPEVIKDLREAQGIAREIFTRMGAKKIVGHQELPRVFSRAWQTSTCRAGASPENSVVDSNFESHDVDNLFVCDASAVPFQCTANAGMPTAAVCSYAWRRIVANHFSRA